MSASTLASAGGPRRTSAVYSLHEIGIARLLFNADYSSFRGVLMNYQDESFSLHGYLHEGVGGLSGDELMNNASASDPAGSSFDVSVTDGETGNQFLLKRVHLTVAPQSPLVCELVSDHLKFRTDELLVGNRADMEIRTFMSPELIGAGSGGVHLGTMTINVQTSITPPPTPQRDSGDQETPMEQSDDFLQ